jgi:cytoskeletal protein CcmA (bactofilin family)
MNRYLPIAVLVLLGAAGCVNASDESTNDNADVTAKDDGDISSVNGSIHVPSGMKRGNVGTVNGSIRVDDAATVSEAHTVNGDIRVGAHATSESLKTVNGSITVGADAHVNEKVTTVNGSLTIRDAAQIGGAVTSVNGSIALTAAHVAGGIESVNGDINVGSNSRVEGGILMRKPHQSLFHWEGSPPRVVIGPGANVQGNLRFERKVSLYVSDRATIGPVIGATAVRFSGDSPPG